MRNPLRSTAGKQRAGSIRPEEAAHDPQCPRVAGLSYLGRSSSWRGRSRQLHRFDKTLNCPGHYSRFDCENGGRQIWAHATENLPQYLLGVDAKGDIYADGIDELLYGRLSKVLGGLNHDIQAPY